MRTDVELVGWVENLKSDAYRSGSKVPTAITNPGRHYTNDSKKTEKKLRLGTSQSGKWLACDWEGEGASPAENNTGRERSGKKEIVFNPRRMGSSAPGHNARKKENGSQKKGTERRNDGLRKGRTLNVGNLLGVVEERK